MKSETRDKWNVSAVVCTPTAPTPQTSTHIHTCTHRMPLSAAGAWSHPVAQWTCLFRTPLKCETWGKKGGFWGEKNPKQTKKTSRAQKSNPIVYPNLKLIWIILNSLFRYFSFTFSWLSLWSFHMSFYFFFQSYAHICGAYWCLPAERDLHSLKTRCRKWVQVLTFIVLAYFQWGGHMSSVNLNNCTKMWCVSLLAV